MSKNCKLRLVALLTGTLALQVGALGAAFTPGDLVVTKVGVGGTTSLTNVGTSFTIEEFTTAGGAVQSVAMPTVTTGANRRITLSGTATTEGAITLSPNGQYLTVAGYDDLGTASPNGASSTTINRVVARIDMSANIDTTTALSDASSGSNIRSAITNGTNIWVAGGAGGARSTTLGSTTSTQLSTAPTNLRILNIFGGQLYTSQSVTTNQGVASIGTGLPTTSGQTTTQLTGFPTSGIDSMDYYFASSSILYIADQASLASGGGLQKWVLESGSWTLKYTLTSSLTNGLRGLAGTLDGSGNATLYAISGDSNNRLVSITDALATTSLPATSFALLATSGSNTAFRGVEILVPEPGTLSLIALAGVVLTRVRRRA